MLSGQDGKSKVNLYIYYILSSIEMNQNVSEQMRTKELSQEFRKDLVKTRSPLCTFPNIFFFLCFLIYAYLFYADISEFWFNPEWVTDDALQQLFPLHSVLDSEIFEGDLISETMKGYLAPLHYYSLYFFTYLTQSPIMAAHWVMLIQVLLTLVFVFLAVKEKSNIAPAFFALTWLLHTRTFMQRITGGLPRGWAAFILPAFLYFAFKKNHKAMLLLLAVGIMLHPPATFLVGVAYGLILFVGSLKASTRKMYIKPFIVLLLLSPIYAFTTFQIIKRPDEVGQMVSFEEASKLPELQRPHGRFPFMPLDSVWNEVRLYGYQPFWHRLYNPGRFLKRSMPYWIFGFFSVLFFVSFFRKRKLMPKELFYYLVAIISVYFASRILAFKLYVPNRHLQLPMSIFWICFFTIGIWNAFVKGNSDNSKLRNSYLPTILYIFLGYFVYLTLGDGLYGSANFNFSLYKKGKAFAWIKKNTPKNALFAGHPTHIDALSLFGMRRAYATTETAHPFYTKYFNEMKRRIEISLKAHYATSLREVLEILKPEKIDYFVFSKKRFYPEALEKERYFEPLNALVQKLTSKDYKSYAYKELPTAVDLNVNSYLVFKDEHSAVVDMKELEKYLEIQS